MTPAQAEATAAVSIIVQRGISAPKICELATAYGLTRRTAEEAIRAGERRANAAIVGAIGDWPTTEMPDGEWR